MKTLHKCISVLLMAIFLSGILVLPVSAEKTTVKHEGLEITIEMDKELYEIGEPVTATITVRNTNTEMVTVKNLEQLIPEGYRLKGGSKANMQNIELRPEQTMSLKVTFAGEAAAEEETTEGFFDKLLYGETWGTPNLLIAVILLIAFGVFMVLT